MSNRLMMDSGAFTVFTQGTKIDLNDYIRFCLKYPKVTAYICLDVIPPSVGTVQKRPNAEELEWSAQLGFKNYCEMVRALPEERVVAVWHTAESKRWLDKYLDMGVPYLGIGGVAEKGPTRLKILQEIRQYLSSRQSGIKLHGFGLTTFDTMSALPWYSVDSSTWVKASAYGIICTPVCLNGRPSFKVPPFKVGVSPQSPANDSRNKHWSNLTPIVKQQVETYLKSIGMGLGEYEIVPVGSGHKRKRREELWLNDKKTHVVRIIRRGVSTCHRRRSWVNILFYQGANQALPIEDLYLAGAEGALVPSMEARITRRMMSYHRVASGKRERERFEEYLETVG